MNGIAVANAFDGDFAVLNHEYVNACLIGNQRGLGMTTFSSGVLLEPDLHKLAVVRTDARSAPRHGRLAELSRLALQLHRLGYRRIGCSRFVALGRRGAIFQTTRTHPISSLL